MIFEAADLNVGFAAATTDRELRREREAHKPNDFIVMMRLTSL